MQRAAEINLLQLLQRAVYNRFRFVPDAGDSDAVRVLAADACARKGAQTTRPTDESGHAHTIGARSGPSCGTVQMYVHRGSHGLAGGA